MWVATNHTPRGRRACGSGRWAAVHLSSNPMSVSFRRQCCTNYDSGGGDVERIYYYQDKRDELRFARRVAAGCQRRRQSPFDFTESRANNNISQRSMIYLRIHTGYYCRTTNAAQQTSLYYVIIICRTRYYYTSASKLRIIVLQSTRLYARGRLLQQLHC